MIGWTTFAVLVVAGGLGAGLRYVIDVLVMRGREDAFPLGILIVNVTGSLALGIVAGLGATIGDDTVAVVGIGLLGGYTTFSTVSVDSAVLAQGPRRSWAWMNLGVTVLAAVLAAALGVAIGGLF